MKKGIIYYLNLIILSLICLIQLAIFITFVFIFLTPEDFCIGTFCLSLFALTFSGASFLLLKLAKSENIIKKILSTICSITLVFLMAIFDICLGFEHELESLKAIKPRRSRYSLNIHRMSKKDYRIKHFPADIPKNATNYYFLIGDCDLHGDQGSYLKFNTNKEYINSVIEKNKNNIRKKIKFKKIGGYFCFMDEGFGLSEEDKNDAWVYVLKTVGDDTNYTSCIITTPSNQIIFFYSNFWLGNFDKW